MAEKITKKKKKKLRPADMAHIALMAVLMAVCAWISIPGPVPFTMQTFAVFAAVGLLGGRRGAMAVVVYCLLGAVGLPVFSGFQGGAAALLGPTGGYIMGFLPAALVYWLVTGLWGKKLPVMALGMALGLLACYALGTGWFMAVYARSGRAMSLLAALGGCVFPFILPDACKIALALFLSRTLSKRLKLGG